MWLNEKVTVKRWHLILNNIVNVPLVILVVHLVLSGADKGSEKLDEIENEKLKKLEREALTDKQQLVYDYLCN